MGESFSESSVLHRKAIAEQRAERLQAKLGYTPRDMEYNEEGEPVRAGNEHQPGSGSGTTGGSGGESFQRFEEELEINDFPQQARWRVTSREALAQISEYSGRRTDGEGDVLRSRGQSAGRGEEVVPGD